MRSSLKWKILAPISVAFLASLAAGAPCYAEPLGREDPIVIGAPIPRASSHGQNAEHALILAVEEINQAGGITLDGARHPVKLEIVDSRDQEPGVPTTDVLLAIEKLILDKKPHVLMGGPIMSESCVVTTDLYAKYKIIDLVTSGCWTPAWHVKVGKDIGRYRYSFKLSGHVGYYIPQLVRLLNEIKAEQGFNKLFASIADAAHARAAAEVVEKLATKGGWQVVGREIHPLATTDYSMMLRDVRKSGAQVLFIWDHTPESVIMLKQWYDLRVPVLPFGTVDMTGDPDMWRRTNGKVAYLIGFGGEAGTLPGQQITPLTKPFFEAYVKRWGREPRTPVLSPSYAGVYMVKRVVERTQSLNADELISAIENVDMETVLGRLRFDKSNHQAIYGENPREALLPQFFQWQDKKRISVWPKAIALKKIQLPPWMK